jgi:hypothetical protein
MFNKIKELLFGKPAQTVAEVPYKVETPVVDTADIALAQLPAGGAEIADRTTQAVVEGSTNRVEKPAAKAASPAAKAPVKKQQFEKKAAPPKPRVPRKPVAK